MTVTLDKPGTSGPARTAGTASTANNSVYRRILRRETHSPRSTFAIVLAVLLALVAAWAATEAVLALLDRPALLVAPADGLAAVLALPDSVDPNLLTAAGIVVAVIGLVILLVALLPGRRANHRGETARTAMVIDNRSIASALAGRAARAAGVDPDQVVVSVGHRLAEVRVRRSSGWPIDKDSVERAVSSEIERLDVTPALKPRVVIEQKGVVGA
jgi:hypothetical protein